MIEMIMNFYKNNIHIKSNFILKCIVTFLAGFFSSQASVFGASYPLSAAICASAKSGLYSIIASFGAILGFLFPTPHTQAMRYISTIVIILFLKLMTEIAFVSLEISHSPAWYAALGMTAGALFSLASSPFNSETVLIYIADVILALVFAYSISDFFETYRTNNTLSALSIREQISMYMLISVVLLCVDVTILPFSIARTVALLIILYTAFSDNELSSITSAFVFMITLCISNGAYEHSILFALCGILGSAIGSKSKPACALSVFVSCILTMAVSSNKNDIASVLFETVISAILFIITPKKVNTKISTIVSPKPVLARTDLLRRNMVNRMTFASQALKEVSSTVQTASERLSKINLPSLTSVFENTREEICKDCTLENHCFGKYKITTVSAFKQICEEHRHNCDFNRENLPKKWSSRCLEPQRVAQSICSGYEDYLSKIEAEQRLAEIRNAVSDQMDSLAITLKDLSAEFDTYEQYDVVRAQKLDSNLRRMGLKPIDVNCRIDVRGRTTVDISIRKSDVRAVNKLELLKRVNASCGRDFDLPVISESGNYIMITLCEKAVYKIDFGAAQHSYKNGKLCGDTYSHFSDGKGASITLLSDGMGSGGRACVDSSMVSGLMSRLLIAGFGFNCALKLVNSAMLFKSSDESLATVDITCVDLYSGDTKFYKAGACETTVIHGAKTCFARCRNLPAGILREVDFEITETTLCEGDTVIMVSDGALYDESDRIEQIARKMNTVCAQQTAETILQNVVYDRTDGHEDDVTIIVLKVKKSH
ncbi:MAG: SpoIIE family protein phosphatase [Acutalibacteraceae bacterium]|nr:SpoIIE family protein phosphatase [Acutalibacteraceae bacterium]